MKFLNINFFSHGIAFFSIQFLRENSMSLNLKTEYNEVKTV